MAGSAGMGAGGLGSPMQGPRWSDVAWRGARPNYFAFIAEERRHWSDCNRRLDEILAPNVNGFAVGIAEVSRGPPVRLVSS